jgi:hypothetical protein
VHTFGFATIKKVHHKHSVTVEQWEVIDLAFRADYSKGNPYLVEFQGEFVNGEGEKMMVPGFYNGDNEWIIRFSASIPGIWTYATNSQIKKLDGKNGQLTVVSSSKLERHGGIIASLDKRKKFFYEDGTPYMLQAFECDWLFALDYHNADAIPKSTHLMNLLAENGINQVVTTVYSYDVNWKKDELLLKYPEHEYGGDDTIYPFLGSNTEPDFSALNITFFKRFDRMLSLMDEHNIVAHLMIYVWNKGVNWPEANSVADNMYFDYIIKRYQAFSNVIWDVSKEALNNARCTEAYGRERIMRINRLDAYDRLITVHDYGFCDRNTDVVDFISVQNWTSTLYSEMLDFYNKFDKPVFNIEHGGYEMSPYTVFPGAYDNPEYCLRRNYMCYFAGVYGTYYWQGAAWNAIIHNPFEQQDEFVKPKFEYYKHLEAFFTQISYERFQPYPEDNKSGYCLKSDDGLTYLYFVPKENYQLSFYNQKGAGVKSGTYQWFNVYTGEYSRELVFEDIFLKAPWRNEADAILIRRLK